MFICWRYLKPYYQGRIDAEDDNYDLIKLKSLRESYIRIFFVFTFPSIILNPISPSLISSFCHRISLRTRTLLIHTVKKIS